MCHVLIVGGGSIGERHLRCFLKTGRAKVALCESREHRLAEMAGRYPLTGSFSDFDSVDPSEFDAAVVCVPAHLHIPIARRLAEASGHLLIEKPLSTQVDGIEELTRVVKERNLTVGVAYRMRATPLWRAVKEALAGGQIGPVRNVVVVSGNDFREARPDYREIYFTRRETGGGVVQDAMTHLVNLVHWMIGPVARVTAVYDHLEIEGMEAEDTASLLLRFRSTDAIATLHSNAWQAYSETAITFSGPMGSILGTLPQSRIGVFLRAEKKWTWTDIPREEPDAKGQVDGPFVDQANNFLDAIEGKGAVLCTLGEARHALDVCLAALESGRSGRFVETPATQNS